MPEIFTKNCKIKVIEYGEYPHQPLFSWREFKSDIQNLVEKIIK